MFVLCHGKSKWVQNDRDMISERSGSGGLTLGKEMVLQENVQLWRAIHGKVANMVVYSCRAAAQPHLGPDALSDGRYLMGALAIHSGSIVYASDEIQWYSQYHGLAHGRMDIRSWQGTLWAFRPDGRPPRPVRAAPVQLGSVMGVAEHAR